MTILHNVYVGKQGNPCRAAIFGTLILSHVSVPDALIYCTKYICKVIIVYDCARQQVFHDCCITVDIFIQN